MGYSAALLDFDGVVGETMEDNFRAWCHALRTLADVPFDRQEYFLLEGARSVEVAATVLRRHGRDERLAEAVVELKDSWYLAHSTFRFHEGVHELIAACRRRGMKLGLVSGGMRRRLLTPQTESLLSTFDVIVTGDDVAEGKPSPEPYLTAARRLGVAPHACLVVENAPYGIRSARAAGMTCFAVCSTLPPERLGEAHQIVADLTGVIPLLGPA